MAANIYGQPFKTYTLASSVIIVPASQTALMAMIDTFMSLLPDPTKSASAEKPDFDQIPPHTSAKLRTELAAMKTAIDAATTS